MKKRLSFFAGYFLFWVLFCWIARLIFLIYNHQLSFSLTCGEWFSAFLHGTRMDASLTGYIAALAAVILAFTVFAGGKTVSKIMAAFTLFVLMVASLLVVADMELYRHWGFRLDSTPLSYLKTPKDALGSVSAWTLLKQAAVFVLLVWGVWRGYRKTLHPMLGKSDSAGWRWGIPAFLFAAAAMILPVRGSLGVAPMNVGFVYFHPNNIFANHAAINVVWNAGKSLMNSDTVSEYNFMDDSSAEDLFAACYAPASRTEMLLNEKQPNVIVIILESFSNRLIEPLGGLQGVTPNLNRLCREGIVFSNIYSGSDRTDKGILAVLNGYPAHPVTKVMNFPEKTRQLPYLNRDMKQAGYHTEFVFGFDIRFSNIASYLGNAAYDKVITRDDFPSETYRGTKWGVPDHWVFEKLLEECNSARPPFFTAFISLSSHEPFVVPMPTAIEGNDEESLFLNSAYYTDKALGDFIAAARKTDWWAHTLIVVTADHGSRHPGNVQNYVPEKFHIPMVWLGGALAKTDTVIKTIAGQTDIPLTILHQTGLRNNDYRFSKDILGRAVSSFAFYTFNNGFGFVDDENSVAFDNVSQNTIYREGTHIEELTETGKAYLQIFSKDFILRDQIHKKPSAPETLNLEPETLNPQPETLSLVNILDADNTILVDLKYATTDNFTGMILYDELREAYLQPDVARMLTEAHRHLKALYPGLRLLVYDAARPLSVQQKMWDYVKDTPYSRYVAHPDRLSLHNFGAAVDLTIADSLGQPLDMGTPFDHFGRAAGTSDEQGLIGQGLLNRQQVQNRELLRQVMRHAGFRSISGEWWHFNACSLQEARQRYAVISGKLTHVE